MKNETIVREERCRRIFENILGEKFPNVGPSWLINHCLELGGYCKKLKLAFEYDGIQHHEYPNPFHRDIGEFNPQKKRDEIKNRRCKLHQVNLIRIKYDILVLEAYIRRELRKKGFII